MDNTTTGVTIAAAFIAGAIFTSVNIPASTTDIISFVGEDPCWNEWYEKRDCIEGDKNAPAYLAYTKSNLVFNVDSLQKTFNLTQPKKQYEMIGQRYNITYKATAFEHLQSLPWIRDTIFGHKALKATSLTAAP